MTDQAFTIEELRDWLTAKVAYFLECTPAEVDPTARLVELGLDSLYALTLCGDIEDEFGIAVEATLAWDHPTVEAIAELLCAELAAQAVGAGTAS